MAVVIYVITKGRNEQESVLYAVSRYSLACENVIVVHEEPEQDRFAKLFEAFENVELMPFEGSVRTARAGYRQALLHLLDQGQVDRPLLLTSGDVFGPVFDPDADQMLRGAELYSSYWHDLALDIRINGRGAPARVPYLDFAVLSPRLLQQAGFATFWREFRPDADPWIEFRRCEIGFARMLDRLGAVTAYPMAADAVGSAEPRLFEVDAVLKAGSPVFPVAVLFLDPLLHDLNAICLRRALDWLRRENPDLYRTVVRFATRHVKPREFSTIADQYEVIPDRPANPEKTEWNFGEVAVFIHAYYADMMPDFWELIERLPCAHHLFLTTATEDNAELIRHFLEQKGLGPDRFTVRVVEQNRGRDMSSLFITWRDIILEDRYDVALRLHSKRTPQVATQVGNSFRDHLFENLVPNEGYVRGILDRLEAEPDIGLVIPPVIHVGFGTLGHSWYNNKPTLHALAKEMYIDVPLDDFTPVTAYGTMYWFRTDALRKMFRWQWKWENYHAEPHHIDGGLAHVQERLIGYCVHDAGFRILQVMTCDMAARNYARLEYKLQLFSGYLGSHIVTDQHYELANARSSVRQRTFRNLRETYGAILRRFPGSRRYLLPFKNVIVAVLVPRR